MWRTVRAAVDIDPKSDKALDGDTKGECGRAESKSVQVVTKNKNNSRGTEPPWRKQNVRDEGTMFNTNGKIDERAYHMIASYSPISISGHLNDIQYTRACNSNLKEYLAALR